MPRFPQPRVQRSPRLTLRDIVPVTIQLENDRQLSARLIQVSIAGGLLELSNYVEERTKVSLIFQVGFAFVHPNVQMLFPMRGGGLGYVQPFRVTSMAEEERHRLQMEIIELLKQSLVPAAGQASGFRPRFFLEST
jgi:hypothetical protein